MTFEDKSLRGGNSGVDIYIMKLCYITIYTTT